MRGVDDRVSVNADKNALRRGSAACTSPLSNLDLTDLKSGEGS
jgi:hypothetical protein